MCSTSINHFKANNNGILTLLTSQMNGVNHRVVTYSSWLTLPSNGAHCCHTKFAALTRPDLPFLSMMDPLHSSITNIKHQNKTKRCCIACYWMFSLGVFSLNQPTSSDNTGIFFPKGRFNLATSPPNPSNQDHHVSTLAMSHQAHWVHLASKAGASTLEATISLD